jgi:hypothetical protein
MATIQTINIGNIVNDGQGDDLRTAFQKVNANFATLNNDLTITASNLGTVGETVFKQKNGLDLEFRKLVAGNKITITSSPDNLLISSTIGNVFQRLTTNSGYVDADAYQYVTFQGNTNIQISAVEDVITVETVLDLNQILKVFDFGTINSLNDNIVQMNTAINNFDFGTITTPSKINFDAGVLR